MMSKYVMALLFGLGLSSAAPLAKAQLNPAFVGKLEVNTAYATGVPSATDVAFAADGRAVITRKTGEVVVRRVDGTLVTQPYPFGGTLDTASEKGLLGVVADPRPGQIAFFFYVSNGPQTDKHRVYRAVLKADDTFVVDATPILAASLGVGPGLEGPANHDGGGMSIHAGQLYIGVGDTGGNATPPTNKYGSCLNKGNGKVLRINLDGSVPVDNPLVGLASATACSTRTGSWTTAAPDPRIYSWGYRNPWRLWVDPATGLTWVGDVGEITREEISITSGNQHHGYPFEEGDQLWGNVEGLNCTSLTPSRACTAPAFAYAPAVGRAVTGGLIPNGCGWTGVFGGTSYVFADSSAGWVRALSVNASRTGFSSTTPVELANFGGSPVSLRMGPDGALFVVSFGLGEIHRYSPVNQSGSDCAAPVPTTPPWGRVGLLVLLVLGGCGVLVRVVSVPRAHAV